MLVTSEQSGVEDRLAQIADSAIIPEVDLEETGLDSQDQIVQLLVDLLKSSGDEMNKKILQNDVLKRQLSTLNYSLFEKFTFSMQSLVCKTPQEKIAWAFEVTSRLSAVHVVPRRRVLSFGDRYIRQHHSAWVQQHGGWEKAFDSDAVD
ncbi:apoptosis facilitator Bcl-2-like protein 14 [Thalassophryne amazonica]|uniref:apoptosis facilitator Bcl-2-like protein 14 n=1 Tax=Thalassophryne amazonica TaxID=390379 RepID=UPI0014711911|nr:apoptosis facilitator Bcl-2-like protein 14 [Thalassophryne amazonica]